MSYNRIGTPRIYTDLISNLLGNGWRNLSNITMLQNDASTAVTFVSGTEADLYDLNPANSVKIAKENQSFYIEIDTGLASPDSLAESNYLAILNHNFDDADVVITVQVDDTSSQFGSSHVDISNTSNHVKLINAAANNTAGEIDPANNGWTLITWATSTSDNQRIRITFEDDGGADENFADDVVMGSIMYGEYFDLPNSPDLSVQTSVDYDGTKLKKSLGGNSYASSTFFGQPDWYKTLAWNNTDTSNQNTYAFEKRTGRMKHALKFSYLTDTDVWSENPSTHDDTDEWFDTLTIHNSFYNKVIGQHHPFLFCIDGASTVEGDYGMFRLSDNSFKATQSANRLWDIAFNIQETW